MVDVYILGSNFSCKFWIAGESSHRAVLHSSYFFFSYMCFVNLPNDVIMLLLILYGCTKCHFSNIMYSP